MRQIRALAVLCAGLVSAAGCNSSTTTPTTPTTAATSFTQVLSDDINPGDAPIRTFSLPGVAPLHVMLGFAEMASDVDLEPTKRSEYLGRIQEAGGELLSLIESTLEIGRLETGRDEVRHDEISLPLLLDELHTTCAAMPREPGVALLWCERVPPARLVSDQRKLSIVLRNLIGNALKFTPRGHVGLTVRVRPQHVDFVVADTGIGIREEDRQAIFEMFRQADQSDSRRFGGTGLGLYIVRRYVEQLGGTIHLESTVGLGSTFTVTVPRGTVPDTSERAA